MQLIFLLKSSFNSDVVLGVKYSCCKDNTVYDIISDNMIILASVVIISASIISYEIFSYGTMSHDIIISYDTMI